eukprot:gene5778-6017_t
MLRLSAVPFYTVGAWTGLMQGYCFAALQLVKYIYGLSWLQTYLESVLPAEKVVAQEHDSTPQQQVYIDVYSALPPAPYEAYVPTEDRIQLLERDYATCQVDSFAIDVSPTNTTATALSLLTAGGLAPCAHADYDAPAVPPLEEGLEGELDLTITHSSGNILPGSGAGELPGLQAAADANGGAFPDQSPSKAAKQYKVASGRTSPTDTWPALPEIEAMAGAPAAAVTADEGHSEAAAPAGDYSQGGEEVGQQHKGLGFLSSLAAPGRAGRLSNASGGSFGGNSTADDDTHSLSSIHTTDSIGTIERKKKRGLFSSLKAKALKGRQQVR